MQPLNAPELVDIRGGYSLLPCLVGMLSADVHPEPRETRRIRQWIASPHTSILSKL
jgi:hypothetical protein